MRSEGGAGLSIRAEAHAAVAQGTSLREDDSMSKNTLTHHLTIRRHLSCQLVDSHSDVREGIALPQDVRGHRSDTRLMLPSPVGNYARVPELPTSLLYIVGISDTMAGEVSLVV